MQSLEVKSSRPRPKSFETETETSKNGSRDASRDRDQVSRLHHWQNNWNTMTGQKFRLTPESSANNFYVISQLQVSQIPKITSKKWTGTWNASRMTTFQGQSAKRRSKTKNFKNAENQLSAVFIFMTPESSAKSVKGVPLDEHFSYQRTFVELVISLCNCCFDSICIWFFLPKYIWASTFLICVFVNLVFHDSFWDYQDFVRFHI